MDQTLLQKHFKGKNVGALVSLLMAETNKHNSESVKPYHPKKTDSGQVPEPKS